MKKWFLIGSAFAITALVLIGMYLRQPDYTEQTSVKEVQLKVSEINQIQAEVVVQDEMEQFILDRLPESNMLISDELDHVEHADEYSDDELIAALFNTLRSGLHLKDKDLIFSAFTNESMQHLWEGETFDYDARLKAMDEAIQAFYAPGKPTDLSYQYEQGHSEYRTATMWIEYEHTKVKIPLTLLENDQGSHEISFRISTPIIDVVEHIKKQASA